MRTLRLIIAWNVSRACRGFFLLQKRTRAQRLCLDVSSTIVHSVPLRRRSLHKPLPWWIWNKNETSCWTAPSHEWWCQDIASFFQAVKDYAIKNLYFVAKLSTICFNLTDNRTNEVVCDDGMTRNILFISWSATIFFIKTTYQYDLSGSTKMHSIDLSEVDVHGKVCEAKSMKV